MMITDKKRVFLEKLTFLYNPSWKMVMLACDKIVAQVF